MCGIIGSTNYKINRITLNSLRHRGPDEYGVYNDNYINLGHTRLSIIDKTTGTQPLIDENLVLIFNGEIYNYIELNNSLKENNTSDTKVLLSYYKKYGINKTLKDINGMFSFSLYDKEKQKIYLVRDRMGIKPLFYYHNNNNLSFCSEINPLKEIIDLPLSIDPISVSIFFNCYYIPSPKTIYKEIHSLEPGNYIEYDLKINKLTKHKYWDLSITEPKPLDINYLKNTLKNSVDIRLRSEVPMGAYLSGGIDSTAVIKYISKNRKNFNTYTALIDHKELNEEEYAIKASGKYKVKYNPLEIKTQEIKLSFLKKLIKHFGQPFADSSIVPTYNISKKIAENVTVALGGDGPDELFGGYNKYEHKTKSLEERFFRNNNLDFLKPFYIKDTMQFLQDRLPYKTTNNEQNLRLLDIKYFLEGDILQKVDRMSMANSLEVRVPFLDHRIVEWSNTISHKNLFGIRKKHVIKKIIEDDFTPNFIERPKIGFMLNLDWVSKFDYYIKNNINKLNIVNNNFNIKQIKDNYLKFAILMFILWYEENYE